MKLSANVTFKFADFARIEALIVPKLIEGAKNGATAVWERSQPLVPVDTGDLKGSATIPPPVEWVGKRVTGYVEYKMPYAAYVEFGTGARGAASPGAGNFPYTMSWPGMVAQPYIRPALDSSHTQVLDALKEALAK